MTDLMAREPSPVLQPSPESETPHIDHNFIEASLSLEIAGHAFQRAIRRLIAANVAIRVEFSQSAETERIHAVLNLGAASMRRHESQVAYDEHILRRIIANATGSIDPV